MARANASAYNRVVFPLFWDASEPVPELPEVETVTRDLRPLLVGKVIRRVRVSKHRLRKPWAKAWAAKLEGKQFIALRRRGKWILAYLGSDLCLIIHLGMTGQLRVFAAGTPVESHTHLRFELEPGDCELRYRDIRRFGSATLIENATDLERFFECLGPDPWDTAQDYWCERLARASRSLKAVLLDQTVVAGVGNIYADESLFEARLPPTRLACSLARGEARSLLKAIKHVLKRAIEKRGSSIRDYIGGSGLKGSFQHEFRVFGRTGEPCPRCQTAIERVRLAGRSTHYCPSCQTT